MQAKKLIEVALPIKEISTESVRDKTIRSGHLSTLHKWWARRPLPISLAVTFSSLVPDPLDENCPKIFKDAVVLLLSKEENPGDPYKPYEDIPYTSAIDLMEDNSRNRLLMFIGKFSNKYTENEIKSNNISVKEYLSDFSLVKWESKHNEKIFNIARKLIFTAYNSDKYVSFEEANLDFEKLKSNIENAEFNLYNIKNRHLKSEEVSKRELELEEVKNIFLNRMPVVFDPFAGGGSIPLEASRLGCRSFGNDINPVAHIIQKGALEYPQKFGKQILFSKDEFTKIYGEHSWNNIDSQNKLIENGYATGARIENRLYFDVFYYAKQIISNLKSEIGHFYPVNSESKEPVLYYWTWVGHCNNPSCKAEVPLLRQFSLSKKKSNECYLHPLIQDKTITFEIRSGKTDKEGFIQRGNLKCPCCGNITDLKSVKQQFIENQTYEKIIAVVWDGKKGKEYKVPNENEIDILSKIPKTDRPKEKMQRNSAGGDTFSWGINEWGQMFSDRQLFTLHKLNEQICNLKMQLNAYDSEYHKAVITYLSIWFDRITTVSTRFSVWNNIQEIYSPCFGRQAISMVFDYPEANPFTETGGGSYINQLDLVLNYIKFESKNPFSSNIINSASGDKSQFESKFITATITDPPYYDAIAYADLSDFFYVWLKRNLGDLYPLNFATPQTPKSDECTALKHHHGGKIEDAKHHFENKLTEIFKAIEYQTSDIISIMFAHQSTEAWTTLCNSVLKSKMNITGSWAIDSEVSYAMKSGKAFLASSVTVACKPVSKGGLADFKTVKKAIETKVAEEVNFLYKLGFRGADLLTACFGQAVSEFGKFDSVEKSDGSEVSVSELLELAREVAFEALLKGFDGDDFTKFYIGWLQLYSFSTNDHNTALRFVQVGLSININDLYKENILILDHNNSTLANYAERCAHNKSLGEKPNSLLIDMVHKAMFLYKGTSRNNLLEFIGKVADTPESIFWRVLTALCELLPNDSDDFQQASGLSLNKDSLIKESKNISNSISHQSKLEF